VTLERKVEVAHATIVATKDTFQETAQTQESQLEARLASSAMKRAIWRETAPREEMRVAREQRASPMQGDREVVAGEIIKLTKMRDWRHEEDADEDVCC